MTASQLRLFVNYRRTDDREFVETLRLQFMNRYGRENVFMDFDSLPNFTNFEEFIKQKVRDSDAVIMMIGKQWVNLLEEKAANDEPDYVLLELEEAVKHNKLIAPIRVRDAVMPKPAAIPDWLRPVTMRNAPDIHPGRHLIDDVTRMINDLEAELARRGSKREIANPESQAQIQPSTSQPLTIQDMQTKIRAAESAKNWPEALIWIDQLLQSGRPMPPYYVSELERRKESIRQRLYEEEDHRRRREVADYEFIFIRDMLEWGTPDETIIEAVRGIWRIADGYLPDDLTERLRPLMMPVIEVVQPPVTPTFKAGDVRADPKGMLQVYVPAGHFLMGSTQQQVNETFEIAKEEYSNVTVDWFAHELPQHEVVIARPFWLDLTPVTNQAYAQFIKEGGYDNQAFWTADGWAWLQKNRDKAPKDYGKIFNELQQPRVGVTWYEAYAYSQ
jgi:hypothetical protein